jgi:hypothetical protein
VGQDFPFQTFQIFFDRLGYVWPCIAMQQNQLAMPVIPFWSFFLQSSIQTDELQLEHIPSDCFSQFQEFVIDEATLVPPEAQHNLGSVNTSFWCRWS